MELKYTWLSNPDNAGQAGLIVPLWNWNAERRESAYLLTKGLIVPLWNWNMLAPRKDLILSKGLIVPLWNWNTDSFL